MTRIKMCGMTNHEDIDDAIALGVHAIGLIFYEGSSRFVTEEQAKTLLNHVPPFVSCVAVMVNPDTDAVLSLMRALPRIDCLQFHGDESATFCEQFNKPYIKACQAISTEAILQCINEHKKAEAILLDTPSKQYGGSGDMFDWHLIPKNLSKPLILSGGLNALNIREALLQVKPYAIDICSGIESKKGKKDKLKMQAVMRELT